MLTTIVILSLLAAGQAGVTPPPAAPTLESVFAQFCEEAKGHPACAVKSPSAGYQWMLIYDACKSSPNVHAYCVPFQAIRTAAEPCVLAYSHRYGRWRPAYAFELNDKVKWAFDRDVDGTPVVVARRSDDCLVIVEETKPLTYSVQLGKVTEKDNDLSGGLKDLAELLGGALSAAAPLLAKHHAQPFRWKDITQQLSLFEALNPFEQLSAEILKLGAALDPLGQLKADLISALNVVEVSESGALSPVDWTLADLDGTSWRDRFVPLRAKRAAAVADLNGTKPNDDQKALLEQSQKLIDKQAEIAKTIGALAAMKARWDEFVLDGRMWTWMVAPFFAQSVKWTKDQTYAFTIVADSPFASDVATRRPKVETSVRFTSPKASMFGVDAGLIVTPRLKEITYKAVADSDGKKHITATGSETRTGKVALFFDWRFVQAWYPKAATWRVRPMLQGGVAVDTKAPGVFMGAGIDITKWIRVSAGLTWLSIKGLDGQLPNTEVSGDDAIKTKTVFTRGVYYAVSLSLDGLPLFKSK